MNILLVDYLNEHLNKIKSLLEEVSSDTEHSYIVDPLEFDFRNPHIWSKGVKAIAKVSQEVPLKVIRRQEEFKRLEKSRDSLYKWALKGKLR